MVTCFEVLGSLNHVAEIVTSADPDGCADATASCLVVYNTGFSGTDLWRGDNAATVKAINPGAPITLEFDNSRFSLGQNAFPGATFLCHRHGGELYLRPDPGRRTPLLGYSRRASHSDIDSYAELTALGNPAEHALMAESVAACQFQYSPVTPTRNAVLSLRLSVAESGESVTLPDQMSGGPSFGTVSLPSCWPDFQSTTVAVDVRAQYVSPLWAGPALIANGVSLPTDGSAAVVDLVFDASCVAPLQVTYMDAGEIGIDVGFVGSGS